MYKVIPSLILLLIVTTSCNLFQKEAKPIDFTTLDRYPVFATCDTTATDEEIKQCFEQTIVSRIQEDLDTCHYMNQAYLRNTGLIIHINVDRTGSCSVAEIEKLSGVEEALPDLEYQIVKTVENLHLMSA